MENLTDILVTQMLNSLDPTPVNPSREEKYLAFLICKNLSDLGETGLAILNKLEQANLPIVNLPDRSSINLCRDILHKFYRDEMFIEDEEFGNRPSWSEVENFDRSKSDTAYRIYRAIKQNAVNKPESKLIQQSVEDRNKVYFIDNFEKIFEDVPFKEALNKFKNFLATDDVDEDDQDYVWEFFDSLLGIFMEEQEIIEDLKEM